MQRVFPIPSRWSGPINLAIAAVTVLFFVGGGHLLAEALIGAQQIRQLEELGRVALRRSEAAVDFGVATLDDLVADGPVECGASAMQSVRLHVYRRGAVKDIRVVDRNGAVRCSAYPDTLEFDRGWVTRQDMLLASDPSLSLFRVDQFFDTALGVMKTTGPDGGLVAILGVSGFVLDIMPTELQGDSSIEFVLSDGRSVASASQGAVDKGAEVYRLAVASERYPFQTVMTVASPALNTWHQEPYLPIVGLSALLGLAFATLLARALNRPRSPVDEIDRAIDAGEFRPYFQPIFDLNTNRIVGAEVLARWVRADGTVLAPARFIELAEQSGRIEAITWQLLSAALDELKPLLKRDKLFKLSVNITPRLFVTPGFVERLRGTVAMCGVATRQIALELTEREAFEDLAEAAKVVAEVRGYGFKVAIDDVGIGHSGLSQLQRLGADILKVDKFFIDSINRDANAVTVVGMLVRLAAEMKMGIVAEGIETSEQAAALRRCGIDCGQGYLVSPPLPPAAFLDLLAARSADQGSPVAQPRDIAAA